ncbi:diacylglycerol kinase family protein [Sphingorhabdus sp. EL138]|jgi:diacylglycerol kinase family enzyme|uniref:diacylglycerol/lipid kinase family protein n=1 Tax=Sphingorhabdus sp. EL138 TaxID=2073156 RepID=UPI000D69DE48|nr:diacylglycerol kinase family protein [Sphingorhabdus sp. EL138]
MDNSIPPWSLTRRENCRHVDPMIVQLIHNPASGTHHELRLGVLAQAFEACGAKVVMGTTEIDGSMKLASDSDLICVSGGDGTLRLVIAAMQKSGSQTPLCIFPAGTVNLVAREIGYASEPEQFASEVMRGFLAGKDARLKEPIVTSDHGPFAACLSAGPDGVAVAQHSPTLKKKIGRAAYAWSFAKLFLRWPRQQYSLEIIARDGSENSLGCEAFYIAKGRYFAGPWTLTPEAGLGGDVFHLIALSRAGRWNFIRFMLSIARGRHPRNLSFARQYPVISMTIGASEEPANILFYQEDGDSMRHVPMQVKMTDYAVEYCLPLDD